jgi:Amt family ammonium transporter
MGDAVTYNATQVAEMLNDLQEKYEALNGGVNDLNLGVEVQWVTFGASLVFLMQSGFSLLEVGSVSKKNTLNILTKNLLEASIGAAVWWAWGNALATSEGNTFIGYTSGFFLKVGAKDAETGWDDFNNTEDIYDASYYINWTFAWAFAATAATIVSGAVAERCNFTAYLIYSILLTGFVYPVVAHMAWAGDGAFVNMSSFNGMSVIDFAGSGVVHMVGGIAALVGAAILGPRRGRFDPQTGLPNRMPAQSSVFQVLGTLLLWVGWYGFNGVSTFITTPETQAAVAAKVSVTTTLSAAFGGIGCCILSKVIDGVYDPSTICNGILAGLVGITASCATVEPEAAVFIGLISSLLYTGAAKLLLYLKIDDVVNASPVHFVCGAWGVIAVGLFSSQNSAAVFEGFDDEGNLNPDPICGVFYGCNKGDDQLLIQFAFVVTVIVWAGTCSVVMFGALKYFDLFRVSADIEEMGLDESEHGGDGAYEEGKPVLEMATTSGDAEQTV